MKNNEIDEKINKIEQSKPYDPLEIAKREGGIYGVGLSGRYKHNLITRIGFILIGIIFLGISFALGNLAINRFSLNAEFSQYIASYIIMLGALIFFIIGILIIKRIFSKDKLFK